jgi:two-component system response regulator YesN
MFKILIVDDEAIERKGLRKISMDAFPNLIIEEAENGRTAILKAEEFRPDIVFMDIKMPGIDGVEAANEIKKMDQSVHIIMVSAFDTFEYARQVMRIGVKNYLLKPYTREEVIEPLKKALNEIEREKEKRKEEIILRDHYRRALSIVHSKVISSLLMEASSNQEVMELELEQTFQKESFVMVFDFRTKDDTSDYPRGNELISFIQAEVNHYFPNHFIGVEKMGRFPILIQVSGELNQKGNVRDRAMRCGKEIIRKVRRTFTEYVLSIGIGRVYEELEEFVQSYHEALFALSSLKHPYECMYFNHYVRETDEGESNPYPYHLEKKLLETVTSGNTKEIPYQLQRFWDALLVYCEKSNNVLEKKIGEFLVLLERQIIDSGLSIPLNRRTPETSSFSVHQSELIRIATHIHSMYYSKNKDILLMAKEYISDHFTKALTLEEVAEVVQLSPQYFSKIFKERVGRSFIDYLTEVRVERAKALIRTEQFSVKKVCFEVGYKDPNYFSRVFKKHTGFSPSEYKQKSFRQ